MGPPLTDYGERGSGPEDVRAILHCCCAGDRDLRVGNLGGDLLYGADPGGVPHQGCVANHV